MPPRALFLFFATVAIWGSTWFVVLFQLGEVDPLVSVIYRFGLAAALLLGWCKLKGLKLTFTLRDHLGLLLQGMFLFGFNYWLVYLAEQYITSGLVAVIFSMLVFFNAINARIILKRPFQLLVLMGGAMGLIGVGLLFAPEVANLSFSDDALLGLSLAVLFTLCASFGNIAAAHNAASGQSILAINAIGMLYGTLVMTIIALAMGKTFNFEATPGYISSLLFLSLLGSIAAFGFYVELMKMVGPEKSAYVSMLMPVVALLISTLWEGYQWTPQAMAGVALILAGNYLVMQPNRDKLQQLVGD